MANTYLQRTPSSTGSQTKFTLSFWWKNSSKQNSDKCFFSSGSNTSNYFSIETTGTEYIRILNIDNASAVINYKPSRVFRDANAWYHIVIAIDTTQAGGNRLKFYTNGVRETAFDLNVEPNQNANVLYVNDTGVHQIGRRSVTAGNNMEGCLSHYHFIDGTAYDATAFGEYDANGVWKPILEPSVTYGTNGFFILKNGNSVTDQSGNSNNWTVGGGTLTNTEDSPSNVFATWNLLQATTSSTYSFSVGNTRVAANDVAQFSLGATLAATTGKYYMEMIWAEHGGYDRWGIMPINASVSSTPHITGIGWDESATNLYMLGNAVSGSWGSNMSGSDIIQIALDLDNGAFYLGVNGTWRNSGDPTSGASRTGAANFSATSLFGEDLTFAVGKGNAGTSSWNANFGNGYFDTTAVASAGTNVSGNGIFEYDVPTGYTALSTKGLNL